MAIFIRITDAYLEAAMEALRAAQPVRVGMGPLAEAILRRAVQACESDPEAWKKIGNSTETPLIPGETIEARPDGSVQDRQSDQAGPSIPPASQEASQSESPDDAIAEAS